MTTTTTRAGGREVQIQVRRISNALGQ